MSKLGHMGAAVHPIEEEFDIINDDLRNNLSKFIGNEESKIFFSEESKNTFLADILKPESHFRDYETEEINLRRNNMWHGTPNIIDFITFNYTNTIEKLLDKTPKQTSGFKINDPIHVHGYYNQRMIMGVNDASQIDNEKLRNQPYIIDALVKSRNNHTYGASHTEKCNALIQSAQLICIYGLSFGDTDKMWWERICKELQHRGDLIILIFWYIKDFPDFSNSGHKFKRIIDQIIDKFLAQGRIADSARSNIGNRIYVTINSSIFNLKIETPGLKIPQP